jgi:hypothetical protein
MKQFIACALLVLLGITASAQIGKKMTAASRQPLEGVWVFNGNGQTLTLVLNADGTGEFEGASISYKTTGNKLSLINEGTTTYNYQLSGDKLTLSGGDLSKPATFIRQGSNTPPDEPATGGSQPSGNSNNIVGTWVSNDIELNFQANGDVLFNGQPFKYKMDKKNLLIYNPSNANGQIPFTYVFNKGKLILTMSNGESSTFEKRAGGATASGSGDPNLIGTWAGQGLEFSFTDSRNLLFNGQPYTYTAANGRITCQGRDGAISYGYEISSGHLMLNYNGTTLMLARKGSGNNNRSAKNTNRVTQPAGNSNTGLLGTWVGTEYEATFMEGGSAIINGETVAYSVKGNNLTLQSMEGVVTVQFKLSGNKLIVNNNGMVSEYQRQGTGNAAMGKTGGGGGSIDQSMVGKWVRMGGGSGGGGSYSYEEYFILYANGTYEYYSERGSNVSGNNQYGNEVFNGGAASQNADKGTWSVRGNVIIANSSRNGVQQYPFQKRNNRNGDPCIVLDGTEYVTATQRAPWR